MLDDCSRLRNVITALPSKRHFIPSLLIIHWAEAESSVASDFLAMVGHSSVFETLSNPNWFIKAKRLESESILQSYRVFAITTATKELDSRLQNVLSLLEFDTEGKLAQSLSSRSLFKAFEPTFTSFFNEWMENSKSSHCCKSLGTCFIVNSS